MSVTFPEIPPEDWYRDEWIARLCAALTMAKRARRKADRAAMAPAERERRAAIARAEAAFNRDVGRAREMFAAEVAAAAKRLERARRDFG